MIIAATYDNGEIFQHFGRTPAFKVYEIEDGAVKASRVVPTKGTGHGALAGMLAELGADVIICGGVGSGAQAAPRTPGSTADAAQIAEYRRVISWLTSMLLIVILSQSTAGSSRRGMK